MTCKELSELVTDYTEGRMPRWQRAQVLMHLAMCRHCRTYVHQMKTTVRILRELPEAPVPKTLRDELVRQFKDTPSKS